MNAKEKIAILFVSAFLMVLGGCVFLRFLQVKLQMRDFENYFRIENRQGLLFTAREPVLFSEDIRFAARRGPTFRAQTGHGLMWRFLFVKKYQRKRDEGGKSQIPLDLFFRDNKLYRVRLPESFYRLIPRAFVVGTLKELGRSQIHYTTRHIAGAYSKAPSRPAFPLIKKPVITTLLGVPFRSERTGNQSRLVYLYLLKRPATVSKKKPASLWARFTFHEKTLEIARLEVKFAGIRMSMVYEPATE